MKSRLNYLNRNFGKKSILMTEQTSISLKVFKTDRDKIYRAAKILGISQSAFLRSCSLREAALILKNEASTNDKSS